jgi:uncharacterized protein (DUF1015 family)
MTTPTGAAAPGRGPRRLELVPFRALRFDPARVGDLAAVTCPPYDVVGPDGTARWEAAHPYNVVRLVLPRPGAGDDAHQHAASRLDAWRSSGVLVRDERPALYVYEQQLGSALTRGLVGAVSLHEPGEAVVLPHEDVFPGPVQDRTELMAATGSQLEPILLTYEGAGPASDLVDRAVGEPPAMETRTDDGASHRVWRITADPDLHTVANDLAKRQVLIADGHHRYAAYLALREHPATAGRPGTSHGLALVVDAHRHPLELAPIHRSVAGLATADAWQRARAGFHGVRVLGTEDPLTAVAAAGREGPALAVGDGTAWSLLTDPEPDLVRRALPADRSQAWRELAASLAHELLMRVLWGVVDTDDRVDFHHDAEEAVARARRRGGVALLLPPPRLPSVLAVAAAGERMPRKSTSFGPKPRTGLLMRLLG